MTRSPQFVAYVVLEIPSPPNILRLTSEALSEQHKSLCIAPSNLPYAKTMDLISTGRARNVRQSVISLEAELIKSDNAARPVIQFVVLCRVG